MPDEQVDYTRIKVKQPMLPVNGVDCVEGLGVMSRSTDTVRRKI